MQLPQQDSAKSDINIACGSKLGPCERRPVHTSPYISQRMLKWPPTWQKGFNYRASKVNLPPPHASPSMLAKAGRLTGIMPAMPSAQPGCPAQRWRCTAWHEALSARPFLASKVLHHWKNLEFSFLQAGRQAGSENNTIQVHSEFRSFKCIHPPIFYHRFSAWGHRNTERTQALVLNPRPSRCENNHRLMTLYQRPRQRFPVNLAAAPPHSCWLPEIVCHVRGCHRTIQVF